MIDGEPWIEVTGIEVDSGSLADHQQQGRHSAQLESRGRAKKQKCSLNSSAEEGEHLTTVSPVSHPISYFCFHSRYLLCVKAFATACASTERRNSAVSTHTFCMA